MIPVSSVAGLEVNSLSFLSLVSPLHWQAVRLKDDWIGPKVWMRFESHEGPIPWKDELSFSWPLAKAHCAREWNYLPLRTLPYLPVPHRLSELTSSRCGSLLFSVIHRMVDDRESFPHFQLLWNVGILLILHAGLRGQEEKGRDRPRFTENLVMWTVS
jgi:hypothetical protein